MKLPTERQCQTAIVQAMRLAGWRVHVERTSQTADGRYLTAIAGDRGFPDIVAVRDGVLLAVELKRDKTGKIGPGQQEWVDALDAVPGVRSMVVWVPSDQDRFIRWMARR